MNKLELILEGYDEVSWEKALVIKRVVANWLCTHGMPDWSVRLEEEEL
jgi:hypothetical protein